MVNRDLLIIAATAGGLGTYLLAYSAYFLAAPEWSGSAVWEDLETTASIHIRDGAYALVGLVVLSVAGACLWTRSTGAGRGPRRLVDAGTVLLVMLVMALLGVGVFTDVTEALVAAAGVLILPLLVVLPAKRVIRAAEQGRPAPPAEPPLRPVVVIVMLLVAAWVVTWPSPGGPAGAATAEAAFSRYFDALAANDRDRAQDLAYPSPLLYTATEREASVDKVLAQVGGRIQIDRMWVTTSDPAEGVVSTRYVGSVGDAPICTFATLYRFDEPFPLRRTRAEGRWFVLPFPFNEQTLAGGECS